MLVQATRTIQLQTQSFLHMLHEKRDIDRISKDWEVEGTSFNVYKRTNHSKHSNCSIESHGVEYTMGMLLLLHLQDFIDALINIIGRFDLKDIRM